MLLERRQMRTSAVRNACIQCVSSRPASESEWEFVQVGASEIFFSLSLSEKISARCSRVASDCIVPCTVRTTVAACPKWTSFTAGDNSISGTAVTVSDEEKLLPLMFWKRNENVHPHLSLLARVFLTPSASSVPVESLFSVTGITKNSRRSSLALYRLNKLTFIHDNYPVFFPIK